MAHKHNRRRLRPRSRNHAPSFPSSSLSDMLSTPGLTEVAPSIPMGTGSNIQIKSRAAVPHTAYNRLTDLTAQHWHNRYLSWQARSLQQQRQEEQKAAAKLEADRCRLFGGEPGDDIRGAVLDIIDVDHDAQGYIDELDGDLVETTVMRDKGRGGYNALFLRSTSWM